MPTKIPKRLLITVALVSTFVAPVAISSVPASAVVSCDRTWNGTTSTDWATASNWTPASAPTSTQTACVPGGTPHNPVVGATTTVASITTSSAGTIDVNAALTITADSTIENLNLNSGGSIGGSGALATTSDVTVDSASGGINTNWTVTGDVDFTGSHAWSNGGKVITVTGSGEFQTDAVTGTPTFTLGGLSLVADGSANIDNVNVTGPVTLNHGLLFFNKTITGNLTSTNGSTIAVNDDTAPMTATVTGTFNFSDGGLLFGLYNSTTNDRLNVGGAVTLADAELSLDNSVGSYVGTLGNTFTVLHAASINGDFAQVDVDSFTTGLYALASYSATDVTATVVPTPGSITGNVYEDYNGDGTLDSDDTSGIGDVAVYDDINNNGVRDQGEPVATTDDIGRYELDLVPVGTAHVRLLTVPSGAVQTVPAVAAPATTAPVSATVAVDTPTPHINIGLFIAADYNPNAGGGNDPVSQGTGYWLVGANGTVYSYGSATNLGSPSTLKLNSPIVGLTPSPQGGGYWAVGSDGGVFAYGTAGFHGSAGSIKLNKPVVGIASTPTGDGYFLVASDGGVFAYGDAKFAGSAGGKPLNQPIVGIASTPDGGGYWLVAKDGGVFAYGDAGYYGSMGGKALNSPIVGIAASSTGDGYRLVAADGGVFAFGDTKYFGGASNLKLKSPIVSIKAIADGSGYWLIGADGGVFAYGDAGFLGGATATAGVNIAQ